MSQWTSMFKRKKVWQSLAAIGVLSAAILVITLIAACGKHGISSPLFQSYFRDPVLLFMNYIPIFLVFLLIYTLSGRLWLSNLLTVSLFFLLSIVQTYKLAFRDEPFTIPEIILFREALKMKGNYNINIFSDNPLFVVAVVAAIAISVVLFFKFKTPWTGKGRWQSFVALALFIALVFQGFTGIYFSSTVYASAGDGELVKAFNRTEEFMSKGLVYPFLFSGCTLRGNKPEGYDKKLAAMRWEEFEDVPIPEEKKVHVLSVMLESYTDLTAFDGVPVHKNVYRFLNKIKKESIHGNLIADIFGGGTVNSERAFLTGRSGKDHAFSAVLVKDLHSHVRYFNHNGYITEALHPIYGWFYNRQNVNPRLGFQDFLAYENYFEPIQAQYDSEWGYTRDDHFLPEVKKRMDEVNSQGKYYFSYALTYQGHGPYADYIQDPKRYLDQNDGIDAKDWAIINNYLSDINATNAALDDFVDTLRQTDAPVVLVFYGDHKPWLGDGESGYHSMGINIDQSTLEGNLNYYTTPYVIWANDAAKAKLGKEFKGQGPDLSPCFLMTYLFEILGWPKNAMMQMQEKYMPQASVLHDGLVKIGGDYHDVNENPKLKEQVQTYLGMEYYRANDKVKD